MKKHEDLTIFRLEKFRDRLRDSFYPQTIPMHSEFSWSPEPVPFEEAANLEFLPIETETKWGSIFDCAWFRLSGVIPEDWKGKEVVALIDVGGEGCIFDEHGSPVKGLTNKKLGWTLEPSVIKKRFYLYEQANGGEKVELMVDAGANNILGVENVLTYESLEDGVFNQADLALFDRNSYELYIDFDILLQLLEELEPYSRHRNVLIFILNEVVNNYGSASPEEVRKCIDLLEPEFNKPANASSLNAIAIGHAHIDIAWLWPLRETVRKVGRTFSTALYFIDRYPDYKFGASQPHLYKMVKEAYPALFERIKKAVTAGRWECQGGMYVEADCNLPSGESLVRQFWYGKKFFKEHFDVEVDNLWLPDVFGYSAALPQMMLKSDINYFMTQKISWNQFNKFPHHTFMWEGIDGSEVFTHFLTPNNYRSDCGAKDLKNLERLNTDSDRTEYALFLYGAGDGGGGPSEELIRKLQRARDMEDLPRVKMAFAQDYFEKSAKYNRDLQKWVGELYLELHRGTLTTQALIKTMNRKLEFLFRKVEKLYAIYAPEAYPQQVLDACWEDLLLNQFHDIIPGTSIQRVNQECLEQYYDIESKLLSLESEGRKLQRQHEDFPNGENVLVVENDLSWNRDDVLMTELEGDFFDLEGNKLFSQKDEDGNTRLWPGNVPSMGWKAIKLIEKPVEVDLVGVSNVMENDYYLLEIDEENGCIRRLYDKEHHREIVAEGQFINHFKLYEDIPNLWDAWDVDVFYEEVQPASPTFKGIASMEHGNVYSALKLIFEEERYVIEQKIILYKNSRRIDFETTIDWHETNKMLRVEFPVNVRSSQASFEIQYGHVFRNTHENTSWDMAQFEVVAHKWADISQPNYGVGIINDCKYGHKIKGNVISLNLLRSPKTPDPDSDMHEHQFTYALYPHAGTMVQSDLIRQAYQLNIPLEGIKADPHDPQPQGSGTIADWSFVQVNTENVVIEVIKKAEKHAGTLIRAYETKGFDVSCQFEFGRKLKSARLVNLVERELQELLIQEGNKLPLDFKPFEIHTFVVE
jgi:alpha-mannosidase